MKISNRLLLRGTAWTIVAYGAGQALRLVTNVTLARMLAPELFGVMVIINSVRTAVDLVSDLGIGQNMVYNSNADKPDFYDTAWTMRIIRACLSFAVCLAAAYPLAQFYKLPELAILLPVAGLFFLIGAAGSMSITLLQRKLQFVRLNVLEIALEAISSAAHIILAYFNPTIWALVGGGLIATAARSISTYFIMPQLRHRLRLSKQYAWQIFSFGKWIFISSIVYFLSMNFDRLYLGKVAPLELLGVYGIARTLSELINALILRLSNYLVFPSVAAAKDLPRTELRRQLWRMRLIFILLGALGISVFATVGDYVIFLLYDARYHGAAWMLPLLAIGAWFALLTSLNESTLLGLGKPSYGALANSLKFGWLLAGLPLGYLYYGVPGAVIAVAAADLWRYPVVALGQFRQLVSFTAQDLIVTAALFLLIGFWQWLRWTAGFGTSFDLLPAFKPEI